MTTFSIDLGSILVANTKSELSLRLSGEATFQPLVVDHFPIIPTTIIQSLLAKSSWVTRGANFCLNLIFHFEQINGGFKDTKWDFLRDLGQVLQEAEVIILCCLV
jgi:hypothetical protein